MHRMHPCLDVRYALHIVNYTILYMVSSIIYILYKIIITKMRHEIVTHRKNQYLVA